MELTARTTQDQIELSKLTVNAQLEDRKHAREHSTKGGAYAVMLLVSIVAGATIVIGLAIFTKQQEIAMEIVKALAYVITGALGGYGARASRDRSKSDRSQPSGDPKLPPG